jgi:ribonuclease G
LPSQMSEWLIEHGIREERALLIDNGEVLAARHIWPGSLNPGQVLEARLATKRKGTKRGVATTAAGAEILIDHLPSEVTEGQMIHVRITRAPIAELGRLKRAIGRHQDDHSIEELQERGATPGDASGFQYPMLGVEKVSQLPTGQGFAAGDWEEVWHAASSGAISFDGGEILCAVTPGMTVIDIDGDLPSRELALAAVPAIAKALKWFDMGGNIGIDFPTLEAKADRRAVDEALANALSDWSHERTAMNGFGFVQIVARLEGPSLLHRFAASRVGMCARYALRLAERAQGTGPILLLTVHPALNSKLKPEWLEELAKRTGREVRIETNPALALEASQAQIIVQ